MNKNSNSTSQHESWHSSKINDNSSFSSIHPTSFQVSSSNQTIGKSFQQLQIQPRNLTWGITSNTSLAGSENMKIKLTYNNNGVPGSKVLDNIRLTAKEWVMENNSTFNMTCLIPM
jgi:hypothetical protein